MGWRKSHGWRPLFPEIGNHSAAGRPFNIFPASPRRPVCCPIVGGARVVPGSIPSDNRQPVGLAKPVQSHLSPLHGGQDGLVRHIGNPVFVKPAAGIAWIGQVSTTRTYPPGDVVPVTGRRAFIPLLTEGRQTVDGHIRASIRQAAHAGACWLLSHAQRPRGSPWRARLRERHPAMGP